MTTSTSPETPATAGLATPPAPARVARTFAGIPVGTYTVAGMSTFDALAFYGMQTLLVYFIYFAKADGGLALDMNFAFAIVSSFSAASFLATIFGSWLCDRVLGPDRTLRWAAGTAVLAYLLLALLPGASGLAIGLVLLCLSAASMWVAEGTLTSATVDRFPAKREAGFTIYYLGSAGGAFVGITLGGFIQTGLGFRMGFIVSAIALALGLGIYLLARRSSIPALPPIAEAERARGWQLAVPLLIVAAAIATLITMVMTDINPATAISAGAIIYAVFGFTRLFTGSRITRAERRRVLRYLPFFFATMIFALLYQQLYTTIAAHSEASTDRTILGFELPPSTILGFAPLCTIVVAPFLAALWGKLGNRQPTLALKFAAAFLFVGAGIVALAASASSGSPTPLLLLAGIVFIFGAADVVLSPSGLSLATEVAPAGHEGRMLALHYVGVSIGTASAGVFSERFVPGETEGPYFLWFGILGLLVAVGMIVVRVVTGKRVSA